MNYRIRINPTVFSAPTSVNPDMKAAGVLKAHVYIGPVNIDRNTLVYYPSGAVKKAYGVNKYMMDISSSGIILPEDSFLEMSMTAFRFEIADLVGKGIVEVAWVTAAGSGVLTVSGVLGA